jgi:uncharacterized membrane protein YkvA (DUF1232 family)
LVFLSVANGPTAARRSRDTEEDPMTDDNLRYFEAFPAWLKSLGDDALALAVVLEAVGTPEGARRATACGLNYLFKSLDLVPDGIDDIGYLDDAFVMRVAARDALAAGGEDLDGALERLAGDVALVQEFLGADYERLHTYVKDLAKGAARGRSVEDLVAKGELRAELVRDVNGFSRGYTAPSFTREEKTLVKLRSFLQARLPAK